MTKPRWNRDINIDMRNSKAPTVVEILIVLIIIVIFGIAAIQPYFEMRTFNKFTKGEKATYWDAVFAQLRISTDGE